MTALEQAVAALEFYASRSVWDDDGGQHASTPAEIDGGRRARKALEALDSTRLVNPTPVRSVA
ncbi:MAG: hypothetical protein JHD16_00170 [Solirubrobacteraceae bacterium]|nr:hypothetical protein [Solirubrobacteraceae bacterium]